MSLFKKKKDKLRKEKGNQAGKKKESNWRRKSTKYEKI